MKMHEKSLFAILLRSPWWASVLAALATAAVARFFVPPVYAAFSALPFLVIASMVAWRQLRAPSAASTAAGLEGLRALPWDELARALEQAWRRQGYEVKAIGAPQADFELAKDSRVTLVACKRWKAKVTGVDPLRELEAAGKAREADECVYLAAGEVTEQARKLAAQKRIRLVEGAELVRLVERDI